MLLLQVYILNYSTQYLLLFRDPHCMATLDTFCEAAAWGARGAFTDQDLTEALLAIFSKVVVCLPICICPCTIYAFMIFLLD